MEVEPPVASTEEFKVPKRTLKRKMAEVEKVRFRP